MENFFKAGAAGFLVGSVLYLIPASGTMTFSSICFAISETVRHVTPWITLSH